MNVVGFAYRCSVSSNLARLMKVVEIYINLCSIDNIIGVHVYVL